MWEILKVQLGCKQIPCHYAVITLNYLTAQCYVQNKTTVDVWKANKKKEMQVKLRPDKFS